VRRIAIWIAAALFLSLGVLANAQEPKEDTKVPQHEEQKPEARPEEANPPRQQEHRPAKPEPRQEEKKQEEPREGDKKAEKQNGEKTTGQKPDQRAVDARKGGVAGKSAHIPDDKFRSSFGRQHTFVVHQPVIVDNQPRFQQGGFWFEIIDPWPADWAYTDECYIDYIDGEYVLFDLLHPGERIVVFVLA
jgi:hypothetical protein